MFNYFQAIERNKIVGKFGVSYLDETLTGIMRGDLVIIGSRAGSGKSSLANMIARANQKRHKIALFSLENFEDDLPMEQTYRYFIKNGGKYCSMREFASGEFLKRLNAEEKKQTARLIEQACEFADHQYDGVNVYNRQSGFTVEELVKCMLSEAEKGTELFIIDHLTYVDKLYSDESDVEHMTTLMRTIRQIQDEKKVAVVGISHLRKPMSNVKEMPVIPSMDEFMGSSNIAKEATVCVLLAPDDNGNKESIEKGITDLKKTWCCIRKNRYGGINNKAANLYFDLNSGEYRKSYVLFSVNYSGTKTEFLSLEDRGDV